MDSTTSPTPSSPERGSLGTGDLASKYTRLAAEYSKVRAQLNVLKKAVIDEQNAKHQVMEALKEHETKNRKVESEMEAITFRNSQLTRRVEILQQESEQKHQKQSSKNKHEITNDVNSVISEELSLKIAENAKLHAALNEVDQKYEYKISTLTSSVLDLESQLKRQAQKDRSEDTKQKELIQGLKFDNVELVSKVSQLETELHDATDKITVLKVQLESRKNSIGMVNKMNSSLSNNISNNFVAAPLNITEARIQTVEILSWMGESVQNFVAAMSDIHTYWEHRLKDLKPGTRLTDQSGKLSEHLMQNVKHLRPIEQAYQDVLSNLLSNPTSGNFGFRLLKQFEDFSVIFNNYVVYAVQDVEPLIVACLHQESNASICPPTQRTQNGLLCNAFQSFGKCLTSVGEHISRLVKVSNNEEALEAVENFAVIVEQLDLTSGELCSLFMTKANDESKLPTVSEALKNTNSCLESALSSLCQCSSTLRRQMYENLPKIGLLLTSELKEDDEIIEQPSSRRVSGIDSQSENNVARHATLTEDVSNVTEQAEESVGARIQDHLISDDENRDKINDLKLNLDMINEKLKKSEQAKEHWKLECQLLQMKLTKLKKTDEEAHPDENQQQKSLTGENGDKLNLDLILENPIKTKIDELISEKLLADSKATQFYLECLALQRRLQYWEKCKIKAEHALKSAQNDIEELKQDAKTTSLNYEDQLSMMSEHLANMNDRLTNQTDEIDRLKYELSNKKPSKR